MARETLRNYGSAKTGAAGFQTLVGSSPVMAELARMVERLAASEIDALIEGESGTGKELVAREIVLRSDRRDGPLVIVDCGSISKHLVESELFGHVRGAFTGADRDRMGAFEAANGGTLFLDEIGELPIELQPKLLRALEAREVRRVGQTHTAPVDVRVLAATNRDLDREVEAGRFREDLYYRLAKVAVRVPPLRERPSDIRALVFAFLESLGKADRIDRYDETVMATLLDYDWPGNVRELRNYVERSVVLDSAPPPSRPSGNPRAADPQRASGMVRIHRDDEAKRDVHEPVAFRHAKEAAIAEFERNYIGPLLERCNGNVSKAARLAKMDRMYLHQLAQKYGLRTTRKD